MSKVDKKDVTVYSCMSNGYERIRDDRIYIPPSDKFKKGVLNAKIPKILSHKYIDTEWSIWVDGNINFKIDPLELLDIFEYKEVGVFRHPQRSQVNQEIDICKRVKLDTPERLEYHRDNPGTLGYCGIIVRKNTATVAKYNEKWWAEICRGSNRDQVSFPYTLGQIANYKDLKGQGNVHESNDYYSRSPHGS